MTLGLHRCKPGFCEAPSRFKMDRCEFRSGHPDVKQSHRIKVVPLSLPVSFRSKPPELSPATTLPPAILSYPPSLLSLASPSLSPPLLPSPAPSSSASKIDSLRSKVDLLKLPLALSTKSISERKSQLGGVGEQRGTAGGGGGGARKARSPPTRDMDNESQYSGYSYKSSHSRSSRKHR